MLIILFAVAEGASRTFEIFNPPCHFNNNEVFQDTEFILQSLICLDSTNIIYDEKNVRKLEPNQHFATININSHGFRGEEIEKDKPENTYRIMVLGGSTAFGMGSTSDQNTIPGYLQKKFDDAEILNVEIINAGVGGTISYEEKYFALNYLIDYKPDLFLIYDGANDVRYRIIDQESLIDNKEKEEGFKFGNYPFYRTPFVISKLTNPNYYSTDAPQNEIISNNIKEKVVDRYIENWKDFCVKQNQIKTMIFLQPIVGTSNRTLSSTDEVFMLRQDVPAELDMLKDIASSLNELEEVCSAAIDLRNSFDGINKPIFYDQAHVSDFGNEIIADIIFENIVDTVKTDLAN
jgi:lysophospholipase L1-like esterase